MAEGRLEGTRSVESSIVSAVVEGPGGFGGESADDIASSSSNPALSCEYFSARIQSVIESKSEYVTAMDEEIEASKVYWSELPEAEGGEQSCLEANKAFFWSLQQEYNKAEGDWFFDDGLWGTEDLGEKIAEGAQGAIYRVTWSEVVVMKVFKLEGGLSLEALHKQWPQGMLNVIQNHSENRFYGSALAGIFRGVMLADGRFGFVLPRYWGDLRKMIDQRMIHNGNQASPFPYSITLASMLQIAKGMMQLHRNGIVHGDLKASNVLIRPERWDYEKELYPHFDPVEDNDFFLDVADFECSVGVVGTRFWRAPELLIALKERCFKPNLCTEKSDVYSFGMTCYEILTGKIPLEEERPNYYVIVLGGKRPVLPSDTYLWFRSMLDKCWHHEPSERPSFEEIVEKVEGTYYAIMGNDAKYDEDVLQRKF